MLGYRLSSFPSLSLDNIIIDKYSNNISKCNLYLQREFYL